MLCMYAIDYAESVVDEFLHIFRFVLHGETFCCGSYEIPNLIIINIVLYVFCVGHTLTQCNLTHAKRLDRFDQYI